MVFRRRFRRARVFKRRRFSTMKRRKMRFAMKKSTKLTRYDGVIYVKAITTPQLVVNSAGDAAVLVVSWGDSGISTNQEVFVDDNPEFQAYLALYEEYRITGVKIEVEPMTSYTNTTATAVFALHRASDPN